MTRRYKQYLRDDSLPIPESTRRYRANQVLETPSPAKRRRAASTISVASEHPAIPQIDTLDSDDEQDPILDFRDGENSPDELGGNHSGEECRSPNTDNQRPVSEDLPVHPGTDVTRGQFLLLALSYVLRHKISGLALTDLLQLLNLVMPGCLPKSKYLWEKLFRSTKDYEKHFCCPNCNSYFGTFTPTTCESCNKRPPIESSSDANFFLVMPLGKQIKDLAVNHELFEKIALKQCDHEHIKDSCCGDLYQRKPVRDILKQPKSISLTWSCDGVPVFSSSKYSIWPVICTINELPYHLRRDHTLLFALWFGKSKPHITAYLQPFVDEMLSLSVEGINWTDQLGRSHNTKVVATVCSCDSVARAMLQNFNQFNGSHGCSFCKHAGETVEKGNGQVRVYTIENEFPEARTDEGTRQDAENSFVNGIVTNGVKGPSVLMNLPNFDIIDGFSPEYMHSVLLGVVRHVTNMWTESSHHRKPYYIGSKLEELNERLLSIRPPREIRRRPRSLNDRKYWKASEWRHFLLIYSGIILRDILPKQFYHHWLLLVNGISLLMGTNITKKDLSTAELCLAKFLYQVPELYGKEQVTFNMHLLTHLVKAVRNQGPLWATSAFVFEDAYGKLQNLFHGTQNVSEQMMKGFFAKRELSLLANVYLPGSNQQVSAMYQALSSSIPTTKSIQNVGALISIGNGIKRQVTIREKLAIQECFRMQIGSLGTFYKRFILNGKIFTTEAYAAPYQRDDCLVHVSSQLQKVCFIQEACVVKPLCTCEDRNSCQCLEVPLLLVKTAPVRTVKCIDNFVEVNLTSFISRYDISASHLAACKLEDVTGKYVRIGNSYAVKLPSFELD